MPRPVSARVAVIGDTPRLLLNDRPVAPLIYALTDCPGARWTWEEVPSRNIQVFAGAGVRLFQADIWFEQMLSAEGELDLSLARRQIAGITTICPDAAVMLRVHVNAPPAWCRAHPDECVGYADTTPHDEDYYGLYRPLATDNGRPLRASFSSRAWLHWACDHLADFCRRLAATPEGDSIFSLQIANGVYGEWHQFGFMHHDPDTGVAATQAFTAWLKERFPHEPARQNTTPPPTEIREHAECGLIRDPRVQRGVIDYYTFLHDELATAVITLAETVKQHWPRPVVTAAFFGYFYSQFGRHTAGSHLSLDRVLASGALDAFCSPQSYSATARQPGGAGNARGLIGPVRRAGKLWLDEMDHGTSIGDCPWDASVKHSPTLDLALMRRNVLQPVTRGGGMWWFEFGPLAAVKDFAGRGIMGWWDHPRIAADIRRIHEVVTARLDRAWRRPADVLIVHEPWGFCHQLTRRNPEAAFGVTKATAGDPFTPRAVDGLLEAFYASGLIAEDVLPGELPAMDLSACRLIIFATMPVMDAAFRSFVRDRLARDGRHIVALGQAGWSDGDTVDPRLGTAWHGFPQALRVPPDGGGSFTLNGFTETVVCETDLALAVLAEQLDAQTIGRWADGTVAAAVRTDENATWWNFNLPPNAPALLREIGRRAGAHIVNDHDDITLLGAGLLVVHTVAGGERSLRIPGGPTVKVTLPPESTTAFDAETGELVLGRH